MSASSVSLNLPTRHLCAAPPFAGCILVLQREDTQVRKERSVWVSTACMRLNECGCWEEGGGEGQGERRGEWGGRGRGRERRRKKRGKKEDKKEGRGLEKSF